MPKIIKENKEYSNLVALMPKSPIRKRLIEPKVRLLLWIYLEGIKDENKWRSKMSKKN
jgi:hypothetical protein